MLRPGAGNGAMAPCGAGMHMVTRSGLSRSLEGQLRPRDGYAPRGASSRAPPGRLAVQWMHPTRNRDRTIAHC